MRLPTNVTAPSKNLMNGLARVQAMKATATANQVNGSSPVSSGAQKSLSDILNNVNAITAPAKISKKAGGEVKVAQAPQDEFSWDRVGDYTPGQVENPHRGLTPQQIARASTDSAMQHAPELRKLSYFNKTLGTRTARDNVIEQLKEAFPGEQSALDELRQDIHAPGNSDQAQSMRVIKKYTSMMSPEAAHATRAAFRRADVRDAIWPPSTKAKTNGKAKETKAKEEGPAHPAT